jgi:carbon starvation protein CstA
MAWSNQALATIVLWAITIYLATERKLFWITLIPAVFMSAVVSSYILVAPEGFGINTLVGQISGVCIAGILMIWFLVWNSAAKKLVTLDLNDRRNK